MTCHCFSELELRVVDMSTLEKEEKKELVYDSKESENTFSIPVETLKSVSKGEHFVYVDK